MGKFDIVVIGTSAGGLSALESILKTLNGGLNAPIAIVQHLSPDSGDSILNLLNSYTSMDVTEPVDKELLLKDRIYLAPPDYHLMIESDRSFCVNMGPKENYCRPSIDALFETAAEVYLNKTLGILLTGANKDGTNGLKTIKKFGGITIAQDPKEAQIATMPQSAIEEGVVDYIFTLDEIGSMLNRVLKE